MNYPELAQVLTKSSSRYTFEAQSRGIAVYEDHKLRGWVGRRSLTVGSIDNEYLLGLVSETGVETSPIQVDSLTAMLIANEMNLPILNGDYVFTVKRLVPKVPSHDVVLVAEKHGIEGIVQRKLLGIDCTEDESVKVLAFFDAEPPFPTARSKTYTSAGKVIGAYFPQEADQWGREMENGDRELEPDAPVQPATRERALFQRYISPPKSFDALDHHCMDWHGDEPWPRGVLGEVEAGDRSAYSQLVSLHNEHHADTDRFGWKIDDPNAHTHDPSERHTW